MNFKNYLNNLIKSLTGLTSFIFLICLMPLLASAVIKVSTLHVDFLPTGNQFQDVFIQNAGTDVEYVNVSLFKRTNPVQDPNKIESASGQNPKDFGMVVTPNKLAIAPGQIKRVRLLNLSHGNKTDVVYGLNILPVPAPVLRSKETEDVHTAAQVEIISAFVVGVYVLPVNPHVNLSLKRDGKTLTAENTGNTNVLLDNGQQCTTDKKPVCTEVDPLRVYGNSKVQIKLSQDLPVTYRESYSDKNEMITSN